MLEGWNNMPSGVDIGLVSRGAHPTIL